MFTRLMSSSYLVAVSTLLKWAWDMLVYLCFFHNCMPLDIPVNGQEPACVSMFHENKSYGDEPVDCAVCLSKIEEDDEIKVLRCDHLFHKSCLDRCVECRHTRCPLCRDVLAGPRKVCELGREVLCFSFSSIRSTDEDDYDEWWIR
ncbi:putative transcription factor interactor and regulator LIM family [Helianthus annuus]|nr:putative transcription factor interactor and regulator LIM family [Helianthus annuus]KAJ0447546.1 putative transcription factor interactor and regulator LIM family [Helianthus annuus]KAJ0632452.1 putative transcription factor interactor and regulator LIM family [Helianthus annuus]KAJ0636305.1 putative transcription factor interactor and regulator LIM family [Helianthus annuus]KAJ0826328.1 putative transcription factor interactor and regulator LIM family [Helianthus annuus]